MDDDFEMVRSERRSFFCPNKLWSELKKQTNDCISVSEYVKKALVEKMAQDEPERKEYFESLLRYS